MVCSVYFLLVLARDNHAFVVNPYLLSVAALTLLIGLSDYVRLYLACRSSVATLNAVDQRLAVVDVTNNESLLASFADYSIATITAPPIPYRIYLKNKDYLVNLWNLRGSEIGIVPSGIVKDGIPKVILERVNDFGHLSKSDFIGLVVSAARSLADTVGKPMPDSVHVFGLTGFSGVPVYELKMFQKSVLWRQLVLRLNPSPEDARHELAIVKRISAENVDVLAYSPLEEPFVSRGALFYYHANIQTNDELSPIDDFVVRFLESTSTSDFANYFNKFFAGLKSVAKVYDSIGDYSVMTIAEAFAAMHDRLPPTYVLDLRSVPYSMTSDEVSVSVK